MRGKFGLALIATLVPVLIFGIISAILSSFFSFSFVAQSLVSSAITVAGTYAALRLSIYFINEEYSKVAFEEYFQFDNSFVQLLIFSLLMTVAALIVQLSVYNFDIELYRQMTDVNFILENIQDPDFINQFIDTRNSALSSLLSLVLFYVNIRLVFVTFIIIDQKLPVIEAFKKGWTYSKGNFFRIFMFFLSFFGWILFGIFTLFIGFLYVIPYIQLATTEFYLTIKSENGDGELASIIPEEKEYDPFTDTEENVYYE